ncbi:hypothetical protein HD554DRAFT_16260 [Boletus coccyginus]|nr:hypothetical protein HD554DRAFT_16260 [Boletus coccyginus]
MVGKSCQMANPENVHLVPYVPTFDTLTACTEETVRQTPYTNRNSFIFRLPSEILETIFIHCARDYHSTASGHRTPTAPRWVNVSYVCRHWRNVALDCSTLWTYLFVTSRRWTEELLARSGRAPLKLHANTDSSHCDTSFLELDIVEQVMNHVERIQELCFHLPFTSSDHQFFSGLSSRAPCLQNLKISTEDDLDCSQWSSILFDGDTPALRTLELTGCPVPWHSLKLSGLKTLSLNNIPARLQQTTVDLLATFSRMHNLEHLHLDNSLASAAGFLSCTAFHTFQKINLPHLSRLLIAAPLSTVIALLSCINIPLKTEVRLECYFERGFSRDDYATLASLLAQRSSIPGDQALSGPTIRSLGIESGDWEMAILTFSASERAFNSSISISHAAWCCNIPLQVVIHFPQSDGDHVVSDICRAMPLTNVQSVHVLHPPSCSSFWKLALGHLPDLRYLKLSRGNMPDLASTLSLAPRDCTKKQDGYMDCGLDRVFAPALEELELYDILLSTSPPDDQQSLYGALSTRRESQGRLTMTQCAVVAKDGRHTMLDMVGRWEGGHFHVVESV